MNLIPMNDDGLFVAKANEEVYCDSRFVAVAFDKRHDNVLQDIRGLLEKGDFGLLNFKESSYKNSQNKKQPCYHMSKDGFAMLAMGFTGDKAYEFKVKYINKFNEMARTLVALKKARADFPLLMEAIQLSHDNPKPYHFSNECDMINRIALGMTAKEYKTANSVPEAERSIRPYLMGDELALIDWLQMLDAGMITGGLTYEQRKNALTTAAVTKYTATTMKAMEKRLGTGVGGTDE